MKLYHVLVAGVATAACLWGFYEIASDVRTSKAIARFDVEVTRVIQSWRNPGLDLLMKFLTHAGGWIGVTLFTTLLFFYLRSVDRHADANFTATLVIAGTWLAVFFKHVLRRVRPEEELALIKMPISPAFPSGHSMASMCLAIAAAEAAIVAPELTWFPTLLCVVGSAVYAISVGISRVYLGVHWPSDVVAAWLLAGAWASGYTGLNRIFMIGR